MSRHIATVSTINLDLNPFANAITSHEFFQCSEHYSSKNVFTFNLLLYCISIELGLKAAILSKNSSHKMKFYLKKQIRHNLIKLYQEFCQQFKNLNLFNQNDIKVIQKINTFYINKSLEYHDSYSLIGILMTGGKGLPSHTEMQSVAKKVDNLIKNYSFFKNSS